MKYLFILLAISLLLACVPSGIKATYPEGSTLCNKNPDCLEGQYCGFTPGFTAAHCKGQASFNTPNLK